jgi:hypothetical protein
VGGGIAVNRYKLNSLDPMPQVNATTHGAVRGTMFDLDGSS